MGDIESGDSDLSDSKATAFFDLVPTIKTACWPNCFARQIGDIVVIHATRHISGGQEMTIAKEDDLDLSECRANDGSGCECPLHEAENLQRPERIKTKRTILERLICGMGTDVKHNVLDQFGRFQIWDKILAELDEAYSDVPRGMPKVVKAQACLLMVNFITEKGKDREAIAKQVILAELGLECLGYRYDVKSEEPKFLKYGVMCSQALTFMEIAAQGSQALQESNANAYSWMLKKLWTIFYAADSSELDTDAVVCSAR